VKILFLDQNKWIELARGVKSPDDFPKQYAVVESLVSEAKAGKIIVPLTFSNLYETQKIANPERREQLARVQSILSKGKVFRGRYKRLEVEVTDSLRRTCGLETLPRASDWFLSNVFFEAQSEKDDPRLPPISEFVFRSIEAEPARYMYEFLAGIDEQTRSVAVARFSSGTAGVLEGIEKRRALIAGETMDMRMRVYSARLLVDELDLINDLLMKADMPMADWQTMKEKACLNLVEHCPAYFIERAIGVRIEAQTRAIQENDLRDMQSFCTATAYSDIMVAEKFFSNLAVQAGLHKKYRTQIITDLYALPALLEA
jgi:hypothetical protein